MATIVDDIAELSAHERGNLIGVLQQLVRTCVDGALGYADAAKIVDAPELRPVFESFAEQRARFADDLRVTLRKQGVKAEPIPTVGGEIHRMWMQIRRSLDRGAAASMLAECERGERSAMAGYEQALKMRLPMEVEVILLDHLAEIRKAHNAFDAMRHPW